jgi:hypothetical protein
VSDGREWRVDLYRDLNGEVYVVLYEFDVGGQGKIISDERFGPFDTARDVSDWLVRHWAPRARLPLS